MLLQDASIYSQKSQSGSRDADCLIGEWTCSKCLIDEEKRSESLIGEWRCSRTVGTCGSGNGSPGGGRKDVTCCLAEVDENSKGVGKDSIGTRLEDNGTEIEVCASEPEALPCEIPGTVESPIEPRCPTVHHC